MKRIRNLCLAAVAALALSAEVGVAGASAANFEAEAYPVTISSSNPYGSHNWSFGGDGTQCAAPALGGTLHGPAASLEPTAGEVTCNSPYVGYYLKTNGCKFIYRPGAKTEAGTYKGTVDIGCPAGQTLTFSGGAAPSSRCMVNVPPQKGLSASYETIGAGKERAVKVTVNATGVQHTKLSGYYCTPGTYSNGTWTGSWKIQATNGFGSVGLKVEGSGGFELPPGGIGISPFSRSLEAGIYPTAITGQQNEGGQHVILTSFGTVACSTVKFSSTISGPTKQFSVSPEYSGCAAFGFPGTVKMNGCTYTVSVLNQAPVGSTFAGHADIACPAGKAIEVVATSMGTITKCTVTIPAQTTDSGGLSLTNEAATSTIGLGLSIKGIDYTRTKGEGLGACPSGEFTDGTYTGSSTLVGSY